LSEKTNAHSQPITSVAFSPDGTKIVSGSWDQTIKVWDSGKLGLLSERTNAHSDWITSVAFSPDGTKIGITSVAFSPDGTKIVSACTGGTIKVWDSGALLPSTHFSLDKTDACWLVWQARWCS
jgi:WD40 repeat protein